MDPYDRPSPAARGDALIRLRTVTTGVAIAGVAATAGFGFAAASGFRGTSTPVQTPGAAATPVPVEQQQAVPNDDGFTAPTPVPFVGVQPPTQGNGRSHVSSGGSGG